MSARRLDVGWAGGIRKGSPEESLHQDHSSEASLEAQGEEGLEVGAAPPRRGRGGWKA